MNHQSDIIIYQTQDGLTKIDVSFDQDTVWLSLEQMAELFQRDRTVIGRHIKNIFSEGELQRDSVCAKFAHTADKSTMPFPEKQPQRLFITGRMPKKIHGVNELCGRTTDTAGSQDCQKLPR